MLYQPLLAENYDKHPIFSTPGTSPLWTAAHIEVGGGAETCHV